MRQGRGQQEGEIMDWIQVVAFGVSGALAVVVARLIIRKPKESKKNQIIYVVTVLVVLFAFNWLVREFVLPDLRNWKAASSLESTALEAASFSSDKAVRTGNIRDDHSLGEKSRE